MIKNDNMSYTAKVRTISVYFDISGTTAVFEAVRCSQAPIRVRRVSAYYYVVTDGGTVGETINVGVRGALTQYATVAPVASTAAGTTIQATLSNPTVLVAKDEPLLITRSAASGQSNTGEIIVTVEYEIMDGPEQVMV